MKKSELMKTLNLTDDTLYAIAVVSNDIIIGKLSSTLDGIETELAEKHNLTIVNPIWTTPVSGHSFTKTDTEIFLKNEDIIKIGNRNEIIGRLFEYFI